MTTEYTNYMKRTNNGRELDARANLADVITTCEGAKYEPKTAIWAGLSLLGELVINLAAIVDALQEDTDE
jgi:hypothetical protein